VTLSAVQKRRIVLDGNQSAIGEGALMKRILLVGYDPLTVDFSDPPLPPGMTAEKSTRAPQFPREKWRNAVGGGSIASSDPTKPRCQPLRDS